MSEIILVYLLALVLAWPLGNYMAGVFAGGAAPGDRLFLPLERAIYVLSAVDARESMSWRRYAAALLQVNLVLAVVSYFVFVFQDRLPLNPDDVAGLDWHLALHTVASFVTNTNQQHYSGQAQLSYLAQTFAIVSMQVITPATGLSALVAILRGLLPRDGIAEHTATGAVSLGNFHVDLVRAIVRILLPLSVVLALLLTWQGVPSTLEGARTVAPLDAESALTEQRIPVGPVAPMVAIKQLGTNGGGWYGPNSAVPLENPTPLSNILETVAIVLIPLAQVIMLVRFSGRRALALSIMGVMLALSLAFLAITVWAENQPNAAVAAIAGESVNLEGKEVRFGATASALWGSLTTQTSNGSVNAMHDSFNPIGGGAVLVDMLMNCTFGGVGVGLVNYLLFLLLAVFLGGLMVGRTPELYGRALETKEIKLLSIALLLQPLCILTLTAWTVADASITGNSNPGYHGLSQVLYEYTSAYANNGSGFEGLGDATPWWNVSCAIVLIVARYLPILVPLAIAAHLLGKRAAVVERGSFTPDTPTFAVFTLAVIVMFALLGFLPALALGPLAEHLTVVAAG